MAEAALPASDFPAAVTAVSGVLLAVACLCTLLVVVDLTRRPQRMGIMNAVWPLTMLFGSVLWLVFYLRAGRAPVRGTTRQGHHHSPATSTAIGASHCGAGCAIGDLVGEFTLVAVPALGAVVGLGTLYKDRIYAGWIIDFAIAYVAGIIFQYWSIAPMRDLGLKDGLVAAVKADTLSIISWQVGMYGVMAVAQFAVLPAVVGGRAGVLSPEFWVVMQVAMVGGFACAYPVNRWLIARGIKEAM